MAAGRRGGVAHSHNSVRLYLETVALSAGRVARYERDGSHYAGSCQIRWLNCIPILVIIRESILHHGSQYYWSRPDRRLPVSGWVPDR
jgi:hypothetical protein